jgi:hypothetical protein
LTCGTTRAKRSRGTGEKSFLVIDDFMASGGLFARCSFSSGIFLFLRKFSSQTSLPPLEETVEFGILKDSIFAFACLFTEPF